MYIFNYCLRQVWIKTIIQSLIQITRYKSQSCNVAEAQLCTEDRKKKKHFYLFPFKTRRDETVTWFLSRKKAVFPIPLRRHILNGSFSRCYDWMSKTKMFIGKLLNCCRNIVEISCCRKPSCRKPICCKPSCRKPSCRRPKL
jgi:hypothetical protein